MEMIGLKKEFGIAIKAERNRRGLSQEILAKRAQLHRTYITDIERGARNLSLESIFKIASALELPIQALFLQPETRQLWNEFTRSQRQMVDVLLIEDDPKDIELTLETFKSAGMKNKLVVMRDGATALDFIFCRRQYAGRRIENNPQLILLDLGLPEVPGLEVLRRIRADERTRHLQVVVLTGSHKDTDAKEAMALGAKAFIVKPLTFQNFSQITPKLSFEWTLMGADLQTP